jgi:cell division protease FtsH
MLFLRSMRPPERLPWIVIVAYVGLLVLFTIAVERSLGGFGGESIDYSAFRRLVENGGITRVWIGESTIRGEARARPAEVGAPDAEVTEYVALRVDDAELVPLLERHGVVYTGFREPAGLSGSVVWWALPLFVVVLLWMRGLPAGGGGQAAMGFGRSRAKLVEPTEVGVSFADVAGVDEAEEELQEVVEFLREPDRFAGLGAKIPKGVLLVGPPGTGKTLLARAVAGEAKVPFFSLTGSEFVEMFVGVGAARVRDLFARAQQNAPCIVFIDELDALGRTRGSGLVSNEERDQTLNQLLAEMDGFDARIGVILMAATNRPETLDPALLRAGRFDRQILVDRPDLAGREAILAIHAKRVRLAPGVDLRAIAAATPGFAGAELANVVNEAAILATRERKSAVETNDLQRAIERIVAGLEKRNRLMNPAEKRRVAYHESGHALVGARLGHGAPVRKISIIPRGLGALGYTLQMPLEDRYLMTREELADKLAMLLAGRAAEEVVFGSISTGAGDDLRQATEIAGRMVREYGMSERLGPLAFDAAPPAPFLPVPGARAPALHGIETAQAIDEEVAVLVRGAKDRASAILEHERARLERLATALLEREVLEGEALEALLAPEPEARDAASA